MYNVVPPVRQHHILERNPFPSADDAARSDFPLEGSDEERLAYARYFNARLRDLCSERGLVFFDVFDGYADSDGFLRRDIADQDVHVWDESFIDQRLAEHGWSLCHGGG